MPNISTFSKLLMRIFAFNTKRFAARQKGPPRNPIVLVILAIFMLFPIRPLWCASNTEIAKPFIMAASNENGYADKLSVLIYTEAFRRLGVPIEFRYYPLMRRTFTVEEGDADGEI